MTHRKLAVGVSALGLLVGGGGAAIAAGTAVPKTATIKESQSFKVKVNRYVQDGLRWDKDVYHVRSGGTLHLVFNVAGEGPHTFTVVRKKDLPTTAKAINNCLSKICGTLAKAHGADPNSDAPPKFNFLENGKGQDTAPNVDRPGDSAGMGFTKARTIDVPVTARKGTTLRFLCLIHPWMQAKVVVG
jgi:hypothetical protein